MTRHATQQTAVTVKGQRGPRVELVEERTVFRQEGEYWTVGYAGVTCRLKDSKGLQHLAYLLQRPGEAVSAQQLVDAARCGAPGQSGTAPGRVAGTRRHPDAERARLTVTKTVKAALQRLAAGHPLLGQHLSATIRRGYFCSYTPDPRHPITWTT